MKIESFKNHLAIFFVGLVIGSKIALWLKGIAVSHPTDYLIIPIGLLIVLLHYFPEAFRKTAQ